MNASLTYVVAVRNGGPGVATGVALINYLPDSVTLVSTSSSQGSCTGSDPVTYIEYGGWGADTEFGGPGNDKMNGGQGSDTCVNGPGIGPRVSCEY
jgi:uncharacterized repeat protein (TIGR01451 family)